MPTTFVRADTRVPIFEHPSDDPSEAFDAAVKDGVSLAYGLFAGLKLPGRAFNGLDLTGACFERADLSGSQFDRVKLNKAQFCRADLSRACLTSTEARGAKFQFADLSRSNWGAANFAEVDLTGAVLIEARLPCASFEGARVAYARFNAAQLWRASFRGVNLLGTDFSGAYTGQIDFTRAIFPEFKTALGANFSMSLFHETYLQEEELYLPPLVLMNLAWPVVITPRFMRIGCQRFRHQTWAKFSDARIDRMTSGSGHSRDFWRKWKAPLLEMCERHRAEHRAICRALGKPLNGSPVNRNIEVIHD